MGNNNEIFKAKYNQLDKLCRQRMGLYNRSKNAILAWSDNLSKAEKDELFQINELRKIFTHQNLINEVSYESIRLIDKYISKVANDYDTNTTNKDKIVDLPDGTFRKI